MATLAEALDQAVQYFHAGQSPHAENICRLILQADSNHTDALHLLGMIAGHTGRLDLAIQNLKRAVDQRPTEARFHNTLALALQAAGRLDEAATHYREALRLRPDFVQACYNLGTIFQAQGQLEEALAQFRKALELNPRLAEAHNNVGAILQSLGQGTEAVAHYQEALRLQPGNADTYFNLGVALQSLGRWAEAARCYQEALRLKPEDAEANFNLAVVHQDQGQIAEASAHYQQDHRLRPSNKLRIVMATLLPAIYDSVEHIQSARSQLIDNIQQLQREQVTMDLTNEVMVPPFYLAYQGCNDRDIQESLAKLYVAPGSPTGAPSPEPSSRSKIENHKSKIKLGFLSAYFKDHTVGRLMRGLIANLSRADFEVVVLSPGNHRDEIAQSYRRCADRFVSLPSRLPDARRLIAEQELDILCYTDIGMDPFTSTLAFARLAPIQCVTWGHPVTTGLGTIDYYLSSELFEAEEAGQHYREKLIRLKTIPAFCERPALPLTGKTRVELGLPDNCAVYVCLQNLVKFHPEFDAILAGILRADPKGILILSEGFYPYRRELLQRRFSTTLGDVLKRVQFVPPLPYVDFLNLNAVADVGLDPIHFGGGRTAYDNLGLGLPMVTMPSRLLRGRMTLGMYKKMGVLDCVAGSPQEYIDLAVRLGTDSDYRAEIRGKIMAVSDVLYEDMDAVRELERFFREAATSGYSGFTSRSPAMPTPERG